MAEVKDESIKADDKNVLHEVQNGRDTKELEVQDYKAT